MSETKYRKTTKSKKALEEWYLSRGLQPFTPELKAIARMLFKKAKEQNYKIKD